VVAKVDLKEEMDRTMYLDNGATRTGQTKFRIRWIYCCADLSSSATAPMWGGPTKVRASPAPW